MASEPLNDPEPQVASLRAERDALARRVRETERIAEDLADQLAAARAELAATGAHEQEDRLALFARPSAATGARGAPTAHSAPLLSGRGSDAGVLPMGLVGLAVVALMVSALSALNSGFFSVVTIAMLAVAIGLGTLAWRTRVSSVEVVLDDGVVNITTRGVIHHFYLRRKSTRLEMHGEPGDPLWEVRFLREDMPPMVVDTSMVDPVDFTDQLRRWRPEL